MKSSDDSKETPVAELREKAPSKGGQKASQPKAGRRDNEVCGVFKDLEF
jgi:hypothetical protein